MIRWIRHQVRARAAGDGGLGLILIIGISLFVFVLAPTATALAVNGVSQSRQRNGYETSLALSETGVDRVLSEVQGAYTSRNADYPAPGPVSAVEPTRWCAGTAVSFPSSGEGAGGIFTTENAERSWARAQLLAVVASGTCTQAGDGGQYVVLKPVSTNVKYGRVYALSAIPSFASPKSRTRLIKSEYVFMPYRPSNAILTNGPLAISSSTTVTAAYGIDPKEATVHSNSTVTGTGNPSVSGLVSSTVGSTFSSNNFALNPGGTVTQTAAEAIPAVSARTFYDGAATSDAAAVVDWYDLCSTTVAGVVDGSVRPYSAAGPCTSATSIGTATTSQQVRGWTFDSSSRTWTATNNALSGTYYAYHGNIDVGPGNTVFPRMTLVAEAENVANCASKAYGNINWDHFTLSTPAYHNLWMFADTDIVTHSNFSAGSFGPPVVSGMFVAGDQIQLETSSAGAVGAVVSADKCPTPSGSGGLITTSEVKNPAVYFDPNSDAPFSSVITTSLWLDYSGG